MYPSLARWARIRRQWSRMPQCTGANPRRYYQYGLYNPPALASTSSRSAPSRVWRQWTAYVSEAGGFFELDRYLLDVERFEHVDIAPAAVVELLTRPDMPSLVLYHGQLMPKSEAIVLFR